jgi:hypothetical protein
MPLGDGSSPRDFMHVETVISGIPIFHAPPADPWF